jgi:2'-5' RNA ligase
MNATARLFFALWPDAAVRAALAQWSRAMHRELGGRITREDSIHLTLLFLGDVGVDRLSRVRAIGDRAFSGAFVLTLDTAVCWQHNGIGWAAPAETPGPLERLAAELSVQAREAGFEPDIRPYNAHVTLLRKARCRPLGWKPAPVDWRIERFVLVRSTLDRNGAIYEEIAGWPLGGAG